MTSINPSWPASWTATSINSSSINDEATLTTAAISSDDVTTTEISVEVAYGATATEGVKVYVLRDIDGTNYEAVADIPFGFQMPHSESTTHCKAFSVSAERIGQFKVHLTNDSGATVTATVRYKQATIESS